MLKTFICHFWRLIMNDIKNVLSNDKPIDITFEDNLIRSITNKLWGPYQSDKYKDVIKPMVIT